MNKSLSWPRTSPHARPWPNSYRSGQNPHWTTSNIPSFHSKCNEIIYRVQSPDASVNGVIFAIWVEKHHQACIIHLGIVYMYINKTQFSSSNNNWLISFQITTMRYICQQWVPILLFHQYSISHLSKDSFTFQTRAALLWKHGLVCLWRCLTAYIHLDNGLVCICS